MKEEIENEITIPYTEYGRVTKMFLTWTQLLQIVGKHNIHSWEGLADIELNALPALYDGWWDTWEIDDEGNKDLNNDFSRLVDKIKEIGWEKIKEHQSKRENFLKKVEELGFKKDMGWVSQINNAYSLITPNALGPGKEEKLYVGNYNPEKDTVKFRDESPNQETHITREIPFDTFIDYVSNPRLPFGDEEKEVNENYTSKIINTIISNIIKENVHK
jgi:hypothetical protein